MKVLFITRSFSKNKGGKEIYNYNLANSLKEKTDLELITTSGSIFNLIWFYPYSLIKGYFSKDITHIHLGDNFMLPIAKLLKNSKKCKLSLTTYGLELTYPSKIYRSLFVNKINSVVDKIIAISQATKEETIKQGISKDKITIIPCAVNPEEFTFNQNKTKDELKKEIEIKFNLDLKNKKILLTTGRLVKRKGVEWFVSNVMPNLPKEYVYLVSGEGEDKANIEKTIQEKNLQERVFLLGRTDFEDLKKLYNIADVFLMPNIHIEGDMEGFGIVILEAGSVGLPVVASNIEGIKDAVKNNVNGLLIAEKDVQGFVNAINKAQKLDKKKIINYVKDNFTWNKIVDKYLEVLR